MDPFAFKFLHPRPLAGEGRGEGLKTSAPRVLLTSGSFCLIFLCLLLDQSITFAQDLRRILYGTTASPSHLPIWVAKDAGFFEKNGLNVEPVQVRGGSLITLARSEERRVGKER